jgi:hypothetical protein
MASYRARCNEQSRIYASCFDQRRILNAGLAAARAQSKQAVVILGFNDCPPCNALEKWMELPAVAKLLAPYEIIEISIFDRADELRPEVFSDIVPALKLPIHNAPPYGVPDFSIVDPAAKRVAGKSIIGFDSDDQTGHIAYLTAHARH